LYPEKDRPDLIARAIVVDGRGKKCGISVSLVKELLATPRMATAMKAHAESILVAARDHMQASMLSAANFTAARRLLRLSYRKLEWLRRLLTHDGKKPRVMHPKYDTSVPANPSIPAMKADEAELLRQEGGVTQQEDGCGAVCEDLDRTLCQGIARAHARGELASTGGLVDPHIYLWAGDGFLARKKSKWVQLGAILVSQTTLNQSPNDSRFVLNYRGGEDYDVLNIRLEDLRPVLQRIAREGVLRDEYGVLPPGLGKRVEFAVGGDKPWLMTVLGRRNMNHTFFSPHCSCTRANIACLDCEGGQAEHYSFDADVACRKAHVCPNMWIRGGGVVPFRCPMPGCGKQFDSLADLEVEEVAVCALDGFVAWAERFSHMHGGMHWGCGVLLPCKWIWSDPLHMFLNLFNVAFDEVIDFYLQHEFVSSDNKALIVECDAVANKVNNILASAHITARFGTGERKAFCGNDLRALMSDAAVLPDILAAGRPLYKRMEPYSFAADAAKARADQQKALERLEKEQQGQGAGRAARFDADDFNETAGISKAAARRVAKQQAALERAAAASLSYEQRFEAHVDAMQQAVEGNYNWRVVNLLHGLVEFYEFVHCKEWLADALAADAPTIGALGLGKGANVAAAVNLRRTHAMERSVLVAKDIIATRGEAREQTYVHDMVYGIHRIFDVAFLILHAGMQGVEHVNKQMKLILVSQCTAANNNRLGKDGQRQLGDVAQAATAIVSRMHIVSGPRAAILPANQYGQMLMGTLGWGSKAHVDRAAGGKRKVFAATSTEGMAALRSGTHSPRPTPAAASPGTMAELLQNPPRKKRLVHGPSILRPDFLEPGPAQRN
jgi:hypothetical protein